ncbi:MAG: alpha/beta hydrolase [Bacteroidales bacterium]|nr:alpha/beta hydrolase [Bacteroidales bacterium]
MKKIIALYILISVFFTCYGQVDKASISSIKNKHPDIAYASGSPAQKLDIYLPDNYFQPLPVIVSIHGGAFMMGDKQDSQLDPMLEGLKRGYAVISVNYRLSDESKFPALVHDVKAAIRWIKANSARYNLNPGRIAVWGGSAGGYLASIIGTTSDIGVLEDLSMGNSGFSSGVQAVVDWFGPVDFLKMDDQFIESGKGRASHSDSDSPESRLMGKQITEIPESVRKTNPATYISAGDSSFFIQHGTDDNTVAVQQSENFYKDLVSVMGNERVTLMLLQGAGHGGPAFSSKENLDLIFTFLDRYLKK